jgi:hypothetical protein
MILILLNISPCGTLLISDNPDNIHELAIFIDKFHLKAKRTHIRKE